MPGHYLRTRTHAGVEWVVLDLLLERTEPWSVKELVETIGNPVAVAEALEILQAARVIRVMVAM
jgi:hypothetical protein